jgi:hypothetical protein
MVKLTASAAVRDSMLVISYEVTNNSAHPIVLWDQMVHSDAEGEHLDPGGAYVFQEDRDVVRVVRAQLELPKDFDVFKKEVPNVRIAAPNSSVHGEIKFTAPLYENSPFYGPPASWHPMPFIRIDLMIGWRELQPGMKLLPRKFGDITVHAVEGRWDQPFQKLLVTTVPATGILNVRTDNFDRSLPMH